MKPEILQPEFLPTTRQEMETLGWDELDILLIQGDAYIDHPAQGPALLGRWLLAHGFRVGLISQPPWRDHQAFTAMGRPRLFAALSAGSMDSMLAHYTAFRKKRSDDALSPGGRAGARPNRATLVYTGLVRAAFPGLTVSIGGLEASLRRLSHYDFWQDTLRRSILLESKANILVYGPGERPLLELARRLSEAGGQTSKEFLSGIDGTVTPLNPGDATDGDWLELPGHEAILEDPKLLLTTALAQEDLIHRGGRSAFQMSGGRGVLMRPPATALTTNDMDFIYALPFTRRAHPSYSEAIPALQVLGASITTHRGCGGGCSFCSLAAHQGRRVISRSRDSILAEAARLAAKKPVALSDVGGPTANMWQARCTGEAECRRPSCLWPKPCRKLAADQGLWLKLLKAIAELPGIKQVRVASGLRYDLAMRDEKSLGEFLGKFVGGQLKIAPEHLDENVLKHMRKPGPELFQKFLSFFERQHTAGQYLVPYLISAFPGSTKKDMEKVAQWFQARHWRPRQVQAFIPTPGTVAAAMFHAECDWDGQDIFVAKTDKARQAQHGLLTDGLPGSASLKKNRNKRLRHSGR